MAKKYTEEYVNINGTLQYFLHYPTKNSGVVGIMLHGGPGLANSYIAYHVQPYIHTCSMVYYDQRGAGKTLLKNKTTQDELSLDLMIEDLRQVIVHVKEKYETENVFLIGHSWGTVLGTQYIIRYPKDVIGYVGYGQEVDFLKGNRRWFLHLKSTIERSGNKKNIKKIAMVNENYPNHMTFDEFHKVYHVLNGLEIKYGYQKEKINLIYRKSPIMTFKDGLNMWKGEKVSQKMSSEVFYNYSILDVKAYEVPVFYILGRHDAWTHSEVAAEYFEQIQSKKGLYWIEDGGHFPELDNPKAFGEAIEDIVAKLQSR